MKSYTNRATAIKLEATALIYAVPKTMR
jgi:hypothetical protein